MSDKYSTGQITSLIIKIELIKDSFIIIGCG